MKVHALKQLVPSADQLEAAGLPAFQRRGDRYAAAHVGLHVARDMAPSCLAQI